MKNEKIQCLNLFVLFILLIGNVNFIGADFSGNVSDVIEDDVVELVEEIIDDVLVGGVLVNESGKDVKNVEDDFNETGVDGGVNVSDEVDVTKEINESVGDEVNVSEKINESVDVNVSVEINESGVRYVDIDDLVSEEDVVSEEVSDKVIKSLVKDGLVEIEFEVGVDENVEIEKKEIMKDDFNKVVRISSNVHFDDELRVYSDLPMPALEENIRIFWENEGVFVLDDVEYFDTDEDGLIDRVSWIVPHLSTQYYNIIIVVDGNDDSTSGTIILNVSSPEDDSTVSNPVLFDINVDYKNLSKIACMLKIDGINTSLILIAGEENMTKELSNGSHNWMVECWEHDNRSESIVSTSGYFNVLDFSIDSLDEFYFNPEEISGILNHQGNSSLSLIGGGKTQGIKLDGNNFVIPGNNISVGGKYELVATSNYYEKKVSTSESFSVGYVEVGFDDTEIEIGDSVEISLEFSNTLDFVSYLLKSNSKFIDAGTFVSGSDSITFTPEEVGSYSLSLILNYSSDSYIVSGKNMLTVSLGDDNEIPEINLYYPDWEEIVNGSVIKFLYSVEDNVDVANCSFKLYNATKYKSGLCGYGELIFPISSADKNLAIKDDLDSNDNVSIHLVDFDEGDYAWEVECYDNAGNHNENFNCFSVDFSGESYVNKYSGPESYDREAEIKNLIDSVNSFLDKKDSFDAEERRALDILGFDDDMNFYKKQLVQMDQDLKFNLRFMTEDKKKDRIKEIYEDIDEMKENIIMDISVEDSYEYTKNSVDFSIENIVSDYMKANGAKISDGTLRRLSKFNKNLQGMLSVKVETWRLKIDYLDKTEDVILVSKKLDINGGFEGKILEVIPDDVSEDVVFISKKKDVNSEIWEIDSDEIEESSIVYYFKGNSDLANIEKTGTLLFDYENGSDGTMITGFFVGVGDALNFFSFFWLAGFLFLGYFGFLVFGKVRLEKWREDANVDKILKLVRETRLMVRQGNVEGARDNYSKMSELYKVLPKKCKMFFYKELGEIRLAINKKDVLNLVNEYESAKDDFRKDDAMRIHSKIGEIYKKLPKKFQDKVYRRIVKKEV